MVEICRRLDGIPLAIELAASRMASMTASEVRDRLDDRFKLLVGSRRGLERHQTLRHAVAWSYDLLDDAEKTLLERCSVFAGGFDLESACAVAGSDDVDDYAVLDLLDALVRKSLLVADRSVGADPVFDAGDDPPVRRGTTRRAAARPTEVRTAHARYFAGRETDIMALWDSPGSGRPTTGSPPNWPTCAPRFGGPPTTATSTWPPPSPPTRRFLGLWVENYEPISLGRRAHRARPRRRPPPACESCHVIASQCLDGWDESKTPVRYCEAGQTVALARRRDHPAARGRRLAWRWRTCTSDNLSGGPSCAAASA